MLTAGEVCERLGISQRTLFRLIRSGRLTAIKTGPAKNARIRVSEEDLADYIERSKVQPEAVNQ